MPTGSRGAGAMYCDYFGLKQKPFGITPDTSLFYAGGQRGEILDSLIYAICQGEGIIKVVGEVGSGKTMLCRMLPMKLSKNIQIVYLQNPSLSPDILPQVIVHELGLSLSNKNSKLEALQVLQAYLLRCHSMNKQVVVLVEEAQSMPLETLEEIRLLSNLETDQRKLLQLVLFAQPELDEKLLIKSMRQLKERITYNVNLHPFEVTDVESYLTYRLNISGYNGAKLFDKKVCKTINKYSNGLTRRINILADKSLMSAYVHNRKYIRSKDVRYAARDSEYVSVYTPSWLASVISVRTKVKI